MVDVVRVTREEISKPFSNHVVVEVTRAGPVRVSGASNLDGKIAYFAPPMFHNVRSALASATAWAGDHGINAVHIYADDASWVEAFPPLDVLREEAQTNTPE